jgi:hypothetical protein
LEWPQGSTPVFFEHDTVVSFKSHWRISWGDQASGVGISVARIVLGIDQDFLPACAGILQ